MKNKKYLKAAELIAVKRTNFACWALAEVEQDEVEFKKLFGPKKDRYLYLIDNPYFNGGSWYGSVRKPKNRLARSLALLLMYEMGEK